MKRIISDILKTFALLLLLLVSYPLVGQEVVVKGAVLDSLSRNPEVAAIVQFYKSEDSSKPIAYTTTDENGRFAHNLTEKGQYRLLLNNLGKREKHIYFVIDADTEIDLGTIVVQDDTEMLEAGSVTAMSNLIVIDADKITYRVENDIESKTKSILDMLRKVPLVSVDALGKITVNGSTSFLVYMDGRKNQMMSDNPTEIFRSMPASFVKDIEVITDPGARYDAEGVGGVLSITSNMSSMTEEEEDMYNANVNLGASLMRVMGGGFFSAKKDKLTVSLNLNGIKVWSGEDVTFSERVQNLKNGQMKTVSSGIMKSVTDNIFGDLSLSYEINRNNLLSFSAGILDVYNTAEDSENTALEMQSEAYKYDMQSLSAERMDVFNANLDYQHTWKNNPGRSLVISYQFKGSPRKTDESNKYFPLTDLPLKLNDRKMNGLSNSMTHIVQVDFNTPLAEGHTLSAGAKMMCRHNLSEYNNLIWDGTDYIFDDSSDINYHFYNNIGAAYAEYRGSLRSFKMRAGVRYEQTWQKAAYNSMPEKDFGLTYGNLVPNATLQYTIDESQNLGLTYSMRISRPGITYLNPYVDLSDPTSKKYGNPDLKAETRHQLGLSYNYYGNKWVVTMRLQQVFKNKGVSAYMFYDDHIMHTTYGNIVNSSSSRLNTYVSWNPFKKTRLMLSGDIGYQIVESPLMNKRNSGWLYSVSANVEQVLPAGIVLSANLDYLPHKIALQSNSNGLSSLMLSVSKGFFDDRLNLNITGITNLNKEFGYKAETHSFGEDFSSLEGMIMHTKDIIFRISYSFGSERHIQVKKSRKKSSSDDQIDLESGNTGAGR